MSAQPEAMRLADALGRLANLEANDLADCMEEAAVELRRLHAENEASTLFSKLTKQLCIEGLTFHDSRATALTHMSRKVPVEVLAKVSRHKNISLLVNTYYRPTVDEIARRL